MSSAKWRPSCLGLNVLKRILINTLRDQFKKTKQKQTPPPKKKKKK